LTTVKHPANARQTSVKTDFPRIRGGLAGGQRRAGATIKQAWHAPKLTRGLSPSQFIRLRQTDGNEATRT